MLTELNSRGVSPNQLAKWRASLKWPTDPPVAATIGHGQLENVLGKIDSDGSSIHFGFPFGVERC